MALSIKEVKQIAQGLQRNTRQSSDQSDLAGSDTDLLAAEVRKPLRAKTPFKLPEKCEMLAEFFNSMESSIRLLRMKGSSPTFANISASIQNLTERRFTRGHLAQLKHILPEAIVIKNMNLHDEVTSCVKPELHVALQLSAFEETAKEKGESGYSVLRRVFRERLVDFSKRHPEGYDIPEEQLPHPFSQTKQTNISNGLRHSAIPPIISSSANTHSQHELAVPSHISRSFQRRFSQKVPISDAQKTSLTCHDSSPLKDSSLDPIAPSPMKHISRLPLRRKSLFGCPIISPSSNALTTHEEEPKIDVMPESISQKEVNALEGTPAKLICTPSKLMSATPDIQTPKRQRPPMDCDTTPLKRSTRRSTQTKLLFNTPKKSATKLDEETEAESSSVIDDVLHFLPQSLLQSVREKERKALVEKDAGVAEARKRQKLIAGLPTTFDMILLIFQSINRSVMTKEELTHKLIANNCKIVDKGEVDEQLKLLQELIPDWISKKIASTGDILYSVNKLSSPQELRQRLVEAE
ncbi:CDT1-like protein a, chloroplastic [Asparagus officinalis]|nr:CDT1-like protein a, chloroplastic [Asparagus officinalis]